jgi:sterol desaturase/sphingolipid hydroxylase (fatty acid hydroxylase superfamily)
VLRDDFAGGGMSELIGAFAAIQNALFEHAVLPAMYWAGLMEFSEQAFDAIEYVLLGFVQIGAVYLLLRPLEALVPAERWGDRSSVRSDVLYTFLNRIGLVPIAVYAVLTPAVDLFDAQLRAAGYVPWSLENWLPVLAQSPLAAFCVYLLVLDFADYWRHRLQHRLRVWWALHSLHHSQRRMTFWNDDRNHLLDELIAGFWFAAVAFLIGVPPEQFVAAVLLTRFVESLSHANVRFGFGALGDRLLVSPRFHRTHHGVGVGHEGAYFGCNFATLFPVWDIVFGTANFGFRGTATGISDQLEGRDYGETFLAQQWLGLKRLTGRA